MSAALLETALALYDAGLCPLPAMNDGSKRPAGKWQQWQAERPSREQVEEWFADPAVEGVGIVCGGVSGNVEMLEIEGRAADRLATIAEAADKVGLGALWRRVVAGYTERTPGGGLHWLIIVTDGPANPNTRLARDASGNVLAETRGTGGWAVLAPSGGRTHPTSNPWVMLSGGPATIAKVTSADRDALHLLLGILDEHTRRGPTPSTPTVVDSPFGRTVEPPLVGDVTPGDDFEQRTSWAEILQPHGWVRLHTQGTTTYWRRPNHADPQAISATTGHSTDGRERLFVFSTSTPFDSEIPYTKFGAYALLNHAGNHSDAARALSGLGYGHRAARSDAVVGGDSDADVPAPPTTERSGKESVATQLVGLALGRYTLHATPDGQPFALPIEGPRVPRLLRGGKGSLRTELASAFFAATGKAAPGQALADAILAIEGFASASSPPLELHMRVAEHDGAGILDLGRADGLVVRVTPDGWFVEQTPPVLFRRTALTGELPVPVRGGSLDELWPLLNVAEADRPLLLAWLVAALVPNIPHPILALKGEQGSGKTTATRSCARLLDPSPASTRKPPRDVEQWVTAAQGSWVVPVDNVSVVQDWFSDALCRAVTGDGDVRRQLYSDGDLTVFAFRRVVLLNGIDLGAVRADLAERLLVVDLHRIDETRRLLDADLAAAWQTAHPRILGALLDLAVKVRRSIAEGLRLEAMPRMADFALVVAAVDDVLGTRGLELYDGQAVEFAFDAVAADPVLAAIAERVRAEWVGPAVDLLAMLESHEPFGRQPAKGWPASAKALSSLLKRQAPSLRKIGWTVENLGADGHDKIIRWRLCPPDVAGIVAGIHSAAGAIPADSTTDTRNAAHVMTSEDATPAGIAGIAGVQYATSLCSSNEEEKEGHGRAADHPSMREGAETTPAIPAIPAIPACSICGELLDPTLTAAGSHPTCGPTDKHAA